MIEWHEEPAVMELADVFRQQADRMERMAKVDPSSAEQIADVVAKCRRAVAMLEGEVTL